MTEKRTKSCLYAGGETKDRAFDIPQPLGREMSFRTVSVCLLMLIEVGLKLSDNLRSITSIHTFSLFLPFSLFQHSQLSLKGHAC